MRRWPVGLVLWLVVLASFELVALVVLWRVFVQSAHGQLLDTVALTGNSIGRTRIENFVDTVLKTISVLSMVIATAVIGFIALIRRRIAVAFGAMLLVFGANVTTQVLQQVIDRPQLGIDPERAAAGNSLPSGHATIAASVAIALIFVLPARVRGVAAFVGAVSAAVVAVATLSAGWHRPSDAVAALLVVGAWACVAGLVIVAVQGEHGSVDYGPRNRFAVYMLVVAGVGLLVGAGIALALTDQSLSTPVEDLSRRRLFVAYAGGALGICGVASVVMASVLATAHRIVPQVTVPTVDAEDDAVVVPG
jgi:membrane-associated phospholipid phosphatase